MRGSTRSAYVDLPTSQSKDYVHPFFCVHYIAPCLVTKASQDFLANPFITHPHDALSSTGCRFVHTLGASVTKSPCLVATVSTSLRASGIFRLRPDMLERHHTFYKAAGSESHLVCPQKIYSPKPKHPKMKPIGCHDVTSPLALRLPSLFRDRLPIRPRKGGIQRGDFSEACTRWVRMGAPLPAIVCRLGQSQRNVSLMHPKWCLPTVELHSPPRFQHDVISPCPAKVQSHC